MCHDVFAQLNEYVVFTAAKKVPQPLFGMAYCSSGSKAILAGGRSQTAGNSDKIYTYDARIDEWLDLSSTSPLKRTLFGSAVYLDEYESVLFAGGTVVGRDHVRLVEDLQYYDMNNYRSKSLGQNPNPAKSMGLVYHEYKVYMFGGSIASQARSGGFELVFSQDMYVYDLKTGALEQLPDLPEAKETRGVVVGNHLYMVGGYGEEASDKIHRFDLSTEQWEKVGKLEAPCSAYALVRYQHYLFLVGDYKNLDQLLVYDTQTEELKTFQMNFGGRHMGAAVLEGALHVFGGYDPESGARHALSQHWKLDLEQFFKYNYGEPKEED
ncbi:hypothetical protein BFP72_16745 [Reichenbachiella sp. 5M10]|nr:hypothetical protein BFP72_16745 [Reichenbachiella sp. 5M10]